MTARDLLTRRAAGGLIRNIVHTCLPTQLSWRRSALVAAFAGSLVLGGCSYLDPGQPIGLVAEGKWTGSQVQMLGAAAECWNLAFGTELVVGNAPKQRALVSFSELVCFFALGRTDNAPPPRIHLCSRYLSVFQSMDAQVFSSAVHEIGHILNIIEHAESSESVMFSGGAGGPLSAGGFSQEDRVLFASANPGFVPKPSCAPAISYYPSPHCSCGSAGRNGP